ncbi:hypothetical protein M885DRAFT_239862 [Pelagophyceae sp. CCMP2097]|nr:hypothetical protein M885DRAFT_239862 [Pelagophyceae sp. CCMP2097]
MDARREHLRRTLEGLDDGAVVTHRPFSDVDWSRCLSRDQACACAASPFVEGEWHLDGQLAFVGPAKSATSLEWRGNGVCRLAAEVDDCDYERVVVDVSGFEIESSSETPRLTFRLECAAGDLRQIDGPTSLELQQTRGQSTNLSKCPLGCGLADYLRFVDACLAADIATPCSEPRHAALVFIEHDDDGAVVGVARAPLLVATPSSRLVLGYLCIASAAPAPAAPAESGDATFYHGRSFLEAVDALKRAWHAAPTLKVDAALDISAGDAAAWLPRDAPPDGAPGSKGRYVVDAWAAALALDVAGTPRVVPDAPDADADDADDGAVFFDCARDGAPSARDGAPSDRDVSAALGRGVEALSDRSGGLRRLLACGAPRGAALHARGPRACAALVEAALRSTLRIVPVGAAPDAELAVTLARHAGVALARGAPALPCDDEAAPLVFLVLGASNEAPSSANSEDENGNGSDSAREEDEPPRRPGQDAPRFVMPLVRTEHGAWAADFARSFSNPVAATAPPLGPGLEAAVEAQVAAVLRHVGAAEGCFLAVVEVGDVRAEERTVLDALCATWPARPTVLRGADGGGADGGDADHLRLVLALAARLDARQRDFVVRSATAASGVFAASGPPGSGRTHALVHAVAARCLADGRSALFVTQRPRAAADALLACGLTHVLELSALAHFDADAVARVEAAMAAARLVAVELPEDQKRTEAAAVEAAGAALRDVRSALRGGRTLEAAHALRDAAQRANAAARSVLSRRGADRGARRRQLERLADGDAARCVRAVSEHRGPKPDVARRWAATGEKRQK